MDLSLARVARPLLVASAVLFGAGVIAASVAEPVTRAATDDVALASSSTTTVPAPTTTSTTVPDTAPTTTAAPVEATAPTPTTTRPTRPAPTTSTTAPPPPSTVVTTPPTLQPPGTALVRIVNETDVPLDIAVNVGALRLGPGESFEGPAAADLQASNAAPGTDLVAAGIPTNYGLRDEGCGDHRLGQFLEPGRRYLIRLYNSGTCQLLGGGPKPTIAITQR